MNLDRTDEEAAALLRELTASSTATAISCHTASEP
jgi:hypothetical protein